MAGTRYLVDSNILIRWVQPSDPGHSIVESTALRSGACQQSKVQDLI